MAKQKQMSIIERFIALPDAEKRRVLVEIDAETPRQRLARAKPLDARDRERVAKFQAKVRARVGRPRIGKGTGTINISVSIERELLKQADAIAKREGLSRSELLARSVRAVIESAA